MKQSESQCGERLEYEMKYRTQDVSLRASLRRIANNIAKKQSLFVVWTVIVLLLVQQSAIARISTSPANVGRGSNAVLTESGKVFIDSKSETKIARVTDSRDGQAVLAQRIKDQLQERRLQVLFPFFHPFVLVLVSSVVVGKLGF